MSIYHGRNARIYIAGYDISALAIALTPAQERELHPYAVLDGVAGYHQMPGLAKDALSIEGLFDDNYMSILKTMFDDGGGKQIVIPFGLTQGTRGLAVDSARMTKYNFSAVVTDVNKLSGEFLAENLPWDEIILLQPKAQETTDGFGDVYNHGAAISSIVGYLQVFECGGDDALIVKIQSDDNAGFTSPVDRITFTTANGITAERRTAIVGVDSYLRMTWAGTPPYQVTFAVGTKII